jgi:ornithine carbamoyltransferase
MATSAPSTASLRGRDVLSFADMTPAEVHALLGRALAMKRGPRQPVLAGKSLAVVFEKPSMRTRVSFDIAMWHTGGHAVYLSPQEVGLGTREPAYDVGAVLSEMVDAIACRTFAQATLEELAKAATVPVINALSDQEHPCQALADILTILEAKGQLKGVTVGYIGDGNNVAASLAFAVASTGGHFRIAAPAGYELPPRYVDQARAIARGTGASVETLRSPQDAARGADVVYTDVWTSMGQETESTARRKAFQGYQVNDALMALAKPDAIFMHDMPAHYGEEVPPGFLASPRSVAYKQAGNRLHAQKALLVAVMGG